MAVTFISHVKECLTAETAARNGALEVIGGKAEAHAKRACPVDTGRLRNDITHAQYDEHTEIIGTSVEYGPYVELGTTRMKAQPFLRPAVENHTWEYRFVIEQFMKHG